MRIENLLFCAILLLILPAAHAIKVLPYIDAGELQYNKTYTYSIYIENDDDVAKSIAMEITPRARYLEPYVGILPQKFLIDKNTGRTVTVILSIPDSMPGEHKLTIMPETSEAGRGVSIFSTFVTTIRFSLPGNVVKSLTTEDLNISVNNDTVTFMIKTKNDGNVRVSAFPAVEIWNQNSFLTRIEGNTEYLIDAGTTKDMKLKYTASSSGKYRAIAFARYDGTITNTIEKEFEIVSVLLQESSGDSGTGGGGTGTSGSPLSNETVRTIDIGGDETVPKAPKDALRILNLVAEPVKLGEPLVMILSLENIDSEAVGYEYMFEVVEDGISLYAQTGSDTINGFETREIMHTWLPDKPGDYTVAARILYGGQLLEEFVSIRVTEIKTPTEILTGFATSNQNNLLVAIIILAIVFVSAIIWKKKSNNSSAA